MIIVKEKRCKQLMLDELELNILIKQGEEKLLEIKKYLFFKDKKERIEELEKKTLKEDFWDDRKKAEKILKTLKILKDKIENFEIKVFVKIH